MNDGYIGSGTRLWFSIKKHGRENFKLEILEFCTDRESLKKREAELITEKMINDPLCMNLKLGGEGGWFLTEAQLKKRNKKLAPLGGSAACKIFNRDSELKRRAVETRVRNNNGADPFTFAGKAHSNKAKEKISKANAIKQLGERNSQFGTCWIFSDLEKVSKKIPKFKLDEYLLNGWSLGRKIKWRNHEQD